MTPTARVVYKPDNKSTDEFVVIVNVEEFTKWRDSEDETIPLSNVVDGPFEIRHKVTKWKPSVQQLHTTFGTSYLEEVIRIALKNGNLKGSVDEEKHSSPIKNESRGSRSVDTRGNGPTGI